MIKRVTTKLFEDVLKGCPIPLVRISVTEFHKKSHNQKKGPNYKVWGEYARGHATQDIPFNEFIFVANTIPLKTQLIIYLAVGT